MVDRPDRIRCRLDDRTYSVPDLKLDDFVVDAETIASEFDSYSDLVLLLELVVHHSFHQTGLAYACVADYNQLKKVILRWQCLISQHLKGNLFDLLNLTLLHRLFLFQLLVCNALLCFSLLSSLLSIAKDFPTLC